MSFVEAIRARRLPRPDGAVLAIVFVLAALAVMAPAQLAPSIAFALSAFVDVLPFLLLSVLLAAYAKATGADALIARAFIGREVRMVAVASLFGALSPFCSCGVIPIIAALLSMGVPLAPVMAFWLASPLMDPSMFALTTGTLGLDFAIAKTITAFSVGILGGYATYMLTRAGYLAEPLREGVGNGGCGASSVRSRKDIVWKFWTDGERVSKFANTSAATLFFLGKWLFLAYLLESLMLAYVPAELVQRFVGDGGFGTIFTASLVGVPAYLNGYAALPLVGGLMEQGMAPGAAMAFLIAGGVTSIPAAIAVWALAKKQVFALYIACSLTGALLAGFAFQLWAA
ncbi:MAG: permease [Tepidamorphaceae bacterium]|nr:permease [Rhodobiaceae bacterium]MCC0047624.1 permease [Rhodobiaceae bacterium]